MCWPHSGCAAAAEFPCRGLLWQGRVACGAPARTLYVHPCWAGGPRALSQFPSKPRTASLRQHHGFCLRMQACMPRAAVQLHCDGVVGADRGAVGAGAGQVGLPDDRPPLHVRQAARRLLLAILPASNNPEGMSSLWLVGRPSARCRSPQRDVCPKQPSNCEAYSLPRRPQ